MKRILIYFLRTFDFVLHLVRFRWSEFFFFAEARDGQQLHRLRFLEYLAYRTYRMLRKIQKILYLFFIVFIVSLCMFLE